MPTSTPIPIRRLAIATCGGDAPGLNAAIRAVVLASSRLGWECWGIRDGFNGLLAPASCRGQPVTPLPPEEVHGIAHLGGTVIGSTSRADPLHYPEPGGETVRDRGDELLALIRASGFDALVLAGGDSSMAIAARLHDGGLRVVGVPKTIDNDLDGTIQAFGFDTAAGFATACIDRLHSTADSQHRVMVVEVMGRHAGWIALHAGLAGGAHVILLPEIPFDIDAVAGALAQRAAAGRGHAIVVAAEGARARGAAPLVQAAAGAGHAARLGGIGARVEAELAARLHQECRSVALGHLLRGGSPSVFDRVAAARLGAAAVRALARGETGVMMALAGPDITSVPLSAVAGRNRRVPLEGDTVRTARDLGICFGDGISSVF